MSFYLSMSILLVSLILLISKNFKNKTKDKVVFVLNSSMISTFFFNISLSLTVFFLTMAILRKGIIQIDLFWALFTLYWVFVLGQKKIVLEKGIGLKDIFKNNTYLVPFTAIIKSEKIKKNKIQITYTEKNKEYIIKISTDQYSIDELESILKKNKIKTITK